MVIKRTTTHRTFEKEAWDHFIFFFENRYSLVSVMARHYIKLKINLFTKIKLPIPIQSYILHCMSLHNEVLKPETSTCTPPGKYCIPKETHPNLLHRRGLRFIEEFTNQFPS